MVNCTKCGQEIFSYPDSLTRMAWGPLAGYSSNRKCSRCGHETLVTLEPTNPIDFKLPNRLGGRTSPYLDVKVPKELSLTLEAL